MSPSARVVNLSRFRADLSRSLARRGQRLLEASDIKDQVLALEPLEAYFIVKELGVDDAAPILRHCSAEQFQTFIDLDCWQDDSPDDIEIDAWLSPFAAMGPEALVDAFLKLDEELQVWFIRVSLEVWNAPEVEDLPDPPKDIVRKTSPDGFFFYQRKVGVVRETDPLVLIDAVYRLDVNEAFKLLTAAQWELASPIEEEARRFRVARVESLGFLPRDRALGLFSPPPTEPPPLYIPKAVDSSSLPAVYASPLAEASLLARALEAVGEPHVLEFLEESLRHLINTAMVAFDESPKDVAHLEVIAARVRDTLCLGLEKLLSPDAPLADLERGDLGPRGASLLQTWSLFDLYRHGHGPVRELHEAATALASEPLIQHWLKPREEDEGAYGEEALDKELLRSLLRHPPLYAGWDVARPERAKAFGSQSEIQTAAARLDAIRDTRG